jgi:hypothetical protein
MRRLCPLSFVSLQNVALYCSAGLAFLVAKLCVTRAKRKVYASQARTVVGLIAEQTAGYEVDYAEIVGCTLVDDGGTIRHFSSHCDTASWKCDAFI